MKFNICKTEITIKYSFFLIIAFSFMLQSYDVLWVLLFSALHEIGHLFLLIIFKANVNSTTIAYYGIGIKYSKMLSPAKEIIFLFGGIAINALFCLLNIRRDINLALLIINSLPVYPLDGGRITKIILNKIFSIQLSDNIFKIISLITFIALITYSVLFKNLSLILISVYMMICIINYYCD